MERSVAAELSIARETSTTYHVLYRRPSEPGSAVTPWCLHGRDTLSSPGWKPGSGMRWIWAPWTKSASRASSNTRRTARLQASLTPWPSERWWR